MALDAADPGLPLVLHGLRRGQLQHLALTRIVHLFRHYCGERKVTSAQGCAGIGLIRAKMPFEAGTERRLRPKSPKQFQEPFLTSS